MTNLRVGVDLGGTNLRVALVDSKGSIIRKIEDETNAIKGPNYVIGKINKMIKNVIGDHVVKGVGIGSPGPLNSYEGVILSPPNLPNWGHVPLVSILQQELQLPVTLENDANAASLGEARVGAGVGYKSVFYITVSTGIGGGFVYNGELLSGALGYAGEIGNMVIVPNGKKSPGTNDGSLESLASGTAIGREGMERLGLSGKAEEVFQEAKQGNQDAKTIIDSALGYLAIGIANIVHTVNPEIFILGGGVMKSADLVLEPLHEKVIPLLYPGLRDSLILVPATLGTKAGVVGAAMLVK